MQIKRDEGNVDPSVGRDARLQSLAVSDLSIEELMAGGADTDTLLEAGVLEADEPRTNFTEPVKPEDIAYTPGPPMPEKQFQEWLSFFENP